MDHGASSRLLVNCSELGCSLSIDDNEATGPSFHRGKVFDDLVSIVVVLDAFSSEAMAPSNTLNSIDEGDVRSIENEVVYIIR
jgi:hypothetical protein